MKELIDYQQFCGIMPQTMSTMNNGIPQMTPVELKQKLDAGDDIFVLDVREPHEFQIAQIGGHLIPARRPAEAGWRTGPEQGNRGALQDGRPQPKSR